MAPQTLIISNLPPDCDQAWLKHEMIHPERIASVEVLKPEDIEKHGVTLVVELSGNKALADALISQFDGTTVGGREVRIYAPIFGR